MTEPSLPVWRRNTRPTESTEPTAQEQPVLRCGGPDLTKEDHLRLRRERRAAWRAEQDRLREEEQAAARRSQSTSDDDEDEDRAAERRRNERYAVTLLRQEDSAWGHGRGDGLGALG